MPRLTIQDVPQDIFNELEIKGKSIRGRVYLRAAKILDEARALDQLIDLHERGMFDKNDPLSIIEKAIKICRIIEGSQIDQAFDNNLATDREKSSVKEPEPEKENDKFPEPYEQKAPMFGN